MHGQCSLRRSFEDVQSCVGCKDRLAAPIEEQTACEWLLEGIKDPLPVPLIDSREWWKLTNFETCKKYQNVLHQMARTEFHPPRFAERGLIYVGGDNAKGERSQEYGLQVAVGIRMTRRYGFHGPVEWWYDSKHETVKQYLTPSMGDVRIRDFRELAVRPRVIRGWPNKLTAIANSKLEEAIFLDADAYLSAPPDALFDLLKEHAFLYWGKNDQWAQGEWICPGVDIGGKNGVQGGQLAFNRSKAWRLIVLAHWINQHSDWYFASKNHKRAVQRQFGDEDAWAIGMGMLKHYGVESFWRNLGTVTPTPRMCNFRLGGKPCITHLCNDKMHSCGYKPWLTHADSVTEACEEMEEAIRGRERNAVWAPEGWRYRKLTWDLAIFDEVARRNEYGIDDLAGGTVLDVGGNTGCFTWLAKQKGAGRIVTVEPHPDNFLILNWNCRAYAECHQVALWSHGAEYLKLIDHETTATVNNTGTAKLGAEGSFDVTVEGFDDFVARTIGDNPIRLLKLDCEGAEIPILLSTQRLRQIEEIKAEMHCGDVDQWTAKVGAIVRRLESAGFEITKNLCSLPHAGHGHLFARKKICDYWPI